MHLRLFSSMVFASTRALVLSSFLIFSTSPCRHSCCQILLHCDKSLSFGCEATGCHASNKTKLRMQRDIPLGMLSTSSVQSLGAGCLKGSAWAPCTASSLSSSFCLKQGSRTQRQTILCEAELRQEFTRSVDFHPAVGK